MNAGGFLNPLKLRVQRAAVVIPRERYRLEALDDPQMIDHNRMERYQFIAFAFIVLAPGDCRPRL